VTLFLFFGKTQRAAIKQIKPVVLDRVLEVFREVGKQVGVI